MQRNVDCMERQRTSPSQRPLQAVRNDGQRSIAVTAGILGPVGVGKLAPPTIQRVHPGRTLDEVHIVVREAVAEAAGSGGQRQRGDGGGHQPPRPATHENRLYLRMCQNAATPSRQLIFFPSAYVRPE